MAPGILETKSENTQSHDGNVETTEGVIGANCVDRITLLRSMPEAPSQTQVCVVGAGPAGLMLGANLARFGIKAQVIDDRADPTPVGRYVASPLNNLLSLHVLTPGTHRADGLQPKTIETFRQMRLADPLLQRGVRVYDISFWRSTADEPLRRLGREVHYPPVIDVLDPYILLVHQGMVESLFIDDMKKRGVEVKRNCAFESYSACDLLMSKKVGAALQINTRVNVTQDKRTILAQYLVGCKSNNNSD